MNLSFFPGDLHLTQNAEGVFVVMMRGKEILSTKSSGIALVRYHKLRAELEKLLPAHEPTAEEKADLLRKEVNTSILEQKSTARTGSTITQITPWALFEVQNALEVYCAVVEASALRLTAQCDYIDKANNFVRWLKGDFIPGSRVGK